MELGEVPREPIRELLRSAASAGGTHPKVAVSTSTPPRIEWASMKLALRCGIDAAEVMLSSMADKPALLVRRFDRQGGVVSHYASAHALFNRASLSSTQVGTWASYAGVARLRQQLPGYGVADDLRQLFRRLVFNVIIGNTDDHARNHGFVMNAAGDWRLSPAFDVLPHFSGGNRLHALEVGPSGTLGSFENVLAGAPDFGLNLGQATVIIRQVASTVREEFPGLLDAARCLPADKDVTLARCLYPDPDL